MPAGILFLAFVLGLLFLATGGLKLVVSHEVGRERIGWIADVPPARYRLAGWLEMAGATGLMFPTMVQAVEWVTPLAAAGLAVLMAFATALHLRRGEWMFAGGTTGLAAVLVLIAISSVIA